MGSRLADGLAHAHGRGILHRDIKPANILLTDDGQPMLLDFNLSEDTKAPTAAGPRGGTLPYMAPEHLRAFRGEDAAVDARSDIYALGIILHELLAGRHPFETFSGRSGSVLERMIAERSAPPAGLRARNSQVSPAVESIVRHCLEPDPARRYQSAAHLHEDLERHLAHLPLRHAPEPSARERAAKWARRHPRLASSTSMAILAGVVLLGVLAAFLARGPRRRHALDPRRPGREPVRRPPGGELHRLHRRVQPLRPGDPEALLYPLVDQPDRPDPGLYVLDDERDHPRQVMPDDAGRGRAPGVTGPIMPGDRGGGRSRATPPPPPTLGGGIPRRRPRPGTPGSRPEGPRDDRQPDPDHRSEPRLGSPAAGSTKEVGGPAPRRDRRRGRLGVAIRPGGPRREGRRDDGPAPGRPARARPSGPTTARGPPPATRPRTTRTRSPCPCPGMPAGRR